MAVENDVPASRRAPRRMAMVLRSLLGAAVFLAAAFYLVPQGLSGHAVSTERGDLAFALDWRSDEAARLLAEQQFASGNYAMAARAARTALANNPLNPQALRVLAMTEKQNKQMDSARLLFAMAGQLSWRDAQTQLFLMADAALSADYKTMIDHADALYRRSQFPLPVLNLLAQSIADPRAWAPLLDKFETNPSLRHELLWRIGDTGAALRPKTYPFLAYLAARHRPASGDEMAPLLVSLVAAGEDDTAYRLWLGRPDAARDPAAPRGGSLLYDGALRVATPVGRPLSPFVWSRGDDPRIETYYGARGMDGQGSGLLVQLQEGVALDIAHQMLMLVPGRYRLTGLVQRDDNGAPRIRLTCAHTGAEIADLEAQLGTAARAHRFTAVIDVPAGCRSQVITIANGLSGSGTSPASFWLADLALRRG